MNSLMNWPLARRLAEASAEAYRQSTVSDRRTDAEANVALDSGGNIIVAFKGSSEPKDFLQDAKFEMSRYGLSEPGVDNAAKAHTGFLEDFDAIKEQVVEQVKEFLSPDSRHNAQQRIGGLLDQWMVVRPQPNVGLASPFPLERESASGLKTCDGPEHSVSNDPVIHESNNPSIRQVFITGHSLGGALAILCALEFCRQKLPMSAVYTFGQPRVGNKAFSDLYDSALVGGGPAGPPYRVLKFAGGGPAGPPHRMGNAEPAGPPCQVLKDITFRVVNQNDIVPRMPGLLLGYRHGGNELFLPTGAVTGWQLNPGPWSRAWSDLLGFYRAWQDRRDVLLSEHFLPAYCRRIQLIA